jgi:hypothetical protein
MLPMRGVQPIYRSSAVDVGLLGCDVIFSPEDGISMFFRNVGIYLQDHTALQPR